MSWIKLTMKLAGLIGLSSLCIACLAQNSETKTISYPADGVTYTSRLLRQNGLLVGYEMEVKNISQVRMDIENLATIPSEATGINIIEWGSTNRLPLDNGIVGYPMHHPTIRQPVSQKRLLPGDSIVIKGSFEEWFNAAYKGYEYRGLTRSDLTNPATPRIKLDPALSYDIGFRPAVHLLWPNQTWSQNARRSSTIGANIAFQNKLTFYNVKVLEK